MIHLPISIDLCKKYLKRIISTLFQPKLTIAKCRLNVENFLEACRRIGVEDVSTNLLPYTTLFFCCYFTSFAFVYVSWRCCSLLLLYMLKSPSKYMNLIGICHSFSHSVNPFVQHCTLPTHRQMICSFSKFKISISSHHLGKWKSIQLIQRGQLFERELL